MTTPIPTWDEIDAMVVGDPLNLRDLAWSLAQRLKRVQGAGSPVEPPVHPVTPAVPREGVSGDEGPPVGGIQDIPAEAVARRFHEAYERLAPAFSYQTREASAVPWEQVPDNNRRLMIAVAAEVYPYLVAPALRAAADEAAEIGAASGWLHYLADKIERAGRSSSGTGTPREVNDHGVRYDEIVVGQWVRLESDDGRTVIALVTRMDTRTCGRVRVYPEHQQGEPYGALFHADDVTALIEEPGTGTPPKEQDHG